MRKIAHERDGKPPPLPVRLVRKLLRIQGIIALLGAFALGVFWEPRAGVGGLLGGLVAWVGSFLFANVMFFRQDMNPRQMLTAMYLAGFAKIVWTVLAFATVFYLTKDLHVIAFFMAYVLVLSAHWFAFLLPAHRIETPDSHHPENH